MTETLRYHIIKTFGNPVNSPKDCEVLSRQISERTKRSISPTTLRRFFGLLPSHSALSTYNLDTLAMFSGADDYDSFCSIHHDNLENKIGSTDGVFREIEKLTAFTLKSIARKSLTDFNRTIPRKGMNERLDTFLRSGPVIYPVIAPGGYGKSTALAHWVRKIDDDNIVLFCPATIFYAMISKKREFKNPISLNLVSPVNLLNLSHSSGSEPPKTLILVIDALDEISTEPEKLYELMDYLLDAAHTSGSSRSLKIIFSIREAAWHSYLAPKFQNKETNVWIERAGGGLEQGYTNLPLLSNEEIREILSINQASEDQLLPYESIPWDIRDLIRIPIYMHFILELLREKKSVEHLTRMDITREYLRSFIFKSRYAEQKEDIIWKIMELMNSGTGQLSITKNELKKYYSVHLKREGEYYKAYRELLLSGILIEEREENKYGIFVSKVAFKHQNFYYYLLALFLIRQNGGLDSELLLSMAGMQKNLIQKTHLVAMFYEIAYENEDFDVLKEFCSLPSEILSSLPVRMSVGESFRRKNDITEKLIKKFASSRDGRIYFFEQFVDTNYLFNNYRYRVLQYLEHERGREAVLFGNSVLFLAGFLEMNVPECKKRYEIIRRIEPDSTIYPWPVGRKVASRILFHSFVESTGDFDLDAFIRGYASIAWAYKGYLENGLIEFEFPIMVALVLVQEFGVLEKLLENAFRNYHNVGNEYDFLHSFKRSQNSLPACFLEYARYKQGLRGNGEPDKLWERTITNYLPTFDDYIYLILINWFLCDFYYAGNNMPKALDYFDSALELARIAEYNFFITFLLKNDPMERPAFFAKAEKMIMTGGFDNCKFSFHRGPSLLP